MATPLFTAPDAVLVYSNVRTFLAVELARAATYVPTAPPAHSPHDVTVTPPHVQEAQRARAITRILSALVDTKHGLRAIEEIKDCTADELVRNFDWNPAWGVRVPYLREYRSSVFRNITEEDWARIDLPMTVDARFMPTDDPVIDTVVAGATKAPPLPHGDHPHRFGSYVDTTTLVDDDDDTIYAGSTVSSSARKKEKERKRRKKKQHRHTSSSSSGDEKPDTGMFGSGGGGFMSMFRSDTKARGKGRAAKGKRGSKSRARSSRRHDDDRW